LVRTRRATDLSIEPMRQSTFTPNFAVVCAAGVADTGPRTQGLVH